jgi:hypothetical protein
MHFAEQPPCPKRGSKDIVRAVGFSHNLVAEDSRSEGKKRDFWHLRRRQNSFRLCSTVVSSSPRQCIDRACPGLHGKACSEMLKLVCGFPKVHLHLRPSLSLPPAPCGSTGRLADLRPMDQMQFLDNCLAFRFLPQGRFQ